MKNQGLVAGFKVIFNISEQSIREITIVHEISTIFEVDDFDLWLDSRSFGFFGKFN